MNVYSKKDWKSSIMKNRILLALVLVCQITWAQKKRISTEDYINTYKGIAISEMNKFGIPASITLAQGILESASGNSYLATEANNHFGIKCHRDWKGGKVYRDDDEANECFRSYKNPKESFKDHSLFLKNRSRYAFLFEEDLADYKAWAKGLKKAGYATNKKYPQLLIGLIEKYELYKYDSDKYDEGEDDFDVTDYIASSSILKSDNGVKYIVATEGDTFESIAKATENRVGKLLEYNELSFEAKLKVGQVIYLQPKRKRSNRKLKTHSVKPGETMYDISQKYAVKLKYLYKRNKLNVGEQPRVGQVIELR